MTRKNVGKANAGIGKSVGAAKSAILRALRSGYAEPTVGIQVTVSDRDALRKYARDHGTTLVQAVGDILLRAHVTTAEGTVLAQIRNAKSSRSGRVTRLITALRKHVDPGNHLADSEFAVLIESGLADDAIKRIYETVE